MRDRARSQDLFPPVFPIPPLTIDSIFRAENLVARISLSHFLKSLCISVFLIWIFIRIRVFFQETCRCCMRSSTVQNGFGRVLETVASETFSLFHLSSTMLFLVTLSLFRYHLLSGIFTPRVFTPLRIGRLFTATVSVPTPFILN